MYDGVGRGKGLSYRLDMISRVPDQNNISQT